jgi:hypothetical protein
VPGEANQQARFKKRGPHVLRASPEPTQFSLYRYSRCPFEPAWFSGAYGADSTSKKRHSCSKFGLPLPSQRFTSNQARPFRAQQCQGFIAGLWTLDHKLQHPLPEIASACQNRSQTAALRTVLQQGFFL